MSRVVPSALLTALSNNEIEPFYAVDLNFDTSPLYLWTGYGDKTIGGTTYTGTGNLLNIEGLEEASDLSARGTKLSLTGLDLSLIHI